MSATQEAFTGERTKLKAIVRHFHEKMTTAMQKAPELEEDKVAALAHIMQHNKLAATKPDYRFPNQNQVNNCWQTVNEYQVCVEQRSKEDATCLQRARDYQSVCPAKWIEDWKSLADEGRPITIGKEFF